MTRLQPTLFHRMQSVITRRLRGVTSVPSSEVHPQIAVYGSQRMCRSCGAITALSKPFCLECGELLLEQRRAERAKEQRNEGALGGRRI